MYTRLTLLKMTDKYKLAITSSPGSDGPPEIPNYSPFIYNFVGKVTEATYFIAGYVHALQPDDMATSVSIAKQLIEDSLNRNMERAAEPASIVIEHEPT